MLATGTPEPSGWSFARAKKAEISGGDICDKSIVFFCVLLRCFESFQVEIEIRKLSRG